MFQDINTSEMEKSEDRLGGFSALQTDVYEGDIKVAYVTKAANSKAQAVNLIVALEGGREYRETIWVTNREGQATYADKKDPSKKHGLPGFHTINDICLVATGKELPQQATEEKIVNIYNFDEKRDVPTSVPVLTDLTGKRVRLAILCTTENKTKKEGNEYVPTAETRDVNTIDKVFDPASKATVSEAREAAKNQTPIEARFHDAWIEKNQGKTKDGRTLKEGQAGKTVGGPPQSGGAPAPKTSLFG